MTPRFDLPAAPAPTVRLAKGREPVLTECPILCLDLGTTTFGGWGWALRWDHDRVACGVETFHRDERHVGRLLAFRRWLRDMLALTGPALVAYLQPAVHDGPGPYGLEGVLLAEVEGCHDHVGPTRAEVRRFATGRSNAGADLLIACARERWGNRDLVEASASALCLLSWTLDQVGEA